ncbi:predicted protein [Nematostella vectensis]|uniref:F-box domain-containing protein n=1 Tax=Nematostella vectensis TaxID=45351 RepID=A7SSV9_NEMVE|nr:F-box/LRR-repeat protein 7 [Nematostella vectensis]EDO33222.1 predicted protein [Nematostella vectensis]|eukprot:XP_001625322.1 predicted protein [Nematostella vectensis]
MASSFCQIMETNIQDLPETVLLQIFHELANKRIYNLFRLRLVCKSWYELTKDSSLWKFVCFPGCDRLDVDVLSRVLSWCPGAREVDISSCPLVNDQCIEVIATRCSHLRTLNVRNCYISDVGLRALATNCFGIKKLVLSYHDEVSITSEVLSELIRQCPQFEHLEILHKDEEDDAYECSFLISTDLIAALVNCPNLKSFHCVNATLLDDTVFDNCRNGHCLNMSITSLSLKSCNDLTNSTLNAFTYNCNALKELDVSFCAGVNDAGIATVSEFCPNLEHLNVRSCQCITDIAIEKIAQNCRGLRYLCVAGCELPRPTGNITDVAIQKVAAYCLKLSHLDVKWCQGVTDIGIGTIASNCPSLAHLNVCGCLAISDLSMLVVATCCTDLECLEIAECLRITHSSLNRIAQNCVKLKYIDMQVCSYLQDLDFRKDNSVQLAMSHIDLSYCTKINDDCVKHIVTECTQLEFISLAGCHRVTDLGLKYIACNCPLLQYVDLSFRGSQSSAHITDDSVMLLAKKCLLLTYLDLIGCWGVTSDCVALISQNCLYLKQFNVSLLFEVSQGGESVSHVEGLVKKTRSAFSVKRVARSLRNGKSAQSFVLHISSLNL